MAWILVALILLLDVAATLSCRRWAHGGPVAWLVASCLLLGAAMVPFGLLMRLRPMSVANVLWIAASIVALTLLDVLIYQERLRLTQLVGFGVVMAGICLVEFIGRR